MSDLNEVEEIFERLRAYPNLLGKIGTMLDLIEKRQAKTADDFEEALIPEVRGLGKEIVKTWATYEEGQTRKDLKNDRATQHSKKKSIGVLHLGK